MFRRGVLIAATVMLGVGSVVWCNRRGAGVPRRTHSGESQRRPAHDVVVASASSALVAAQWSTWVARGVSVGVGRGGGPGNGDSLWYHLPFAAAFAQSGWLSRLQYLNGEALVTYYPANTSVLHAVGLLTMGSDVLSLFINLALAPIALLAGWCIGERGGVGPACLAGVAVALTIPVVVVSEAGTAKDDVLGIVGLLACTAFIVHANGGAPDDRPSERATALYGGLAAGLAIGSKLTFVVPIVALGVSLAIMTPAPSRLSTMTRWSAATFATGGYWYLRNLIAVGNPLPGIGASLGRVHLPRPPIPSMDHFGTNLLHNVGNGRVWSDALLPGLRTGFGTAWPVMLVVAAGAIVAGLVTLRGREIVAPAVGVVAFAGFLVTPGTVWAPQLITRPGVHFVTANLFAFNLRYMLPAVAIGLVIVPLVARRWQDGPLIATAPLGIALASIQLSPQSRHSWSPHHVAIASACGVTVGAIMVALTGGWDGFRWSARWPHRVLVATVAVILGAVALGWPLQRSYSRHRYASFDLAAWADKLPGERIGYSGFVFSYPLYGSHLQNQVRMIGEHGPHGAWHPVTTCSAWRRAVRDAGVRYVVVPAGPPAVVLGIDLARWRVGLPGGEPPDTPPESRWTSSDPGVRAVFRSAEGAVAYAVTGPATARGCT